jgi:diadenosine tetraphosphate (Ap4A) HIT family hydrolase
MSRDDCSVCAELDGRVPVPGGILFQDASWQVAHHAGPWTDPGELIVKARRHVESLAQLNEAETASLGPVLRAAVAAVERVVRPERVYVASYGERVRHVHFFLLPRTTSLPAGHVLSDVYRRGRSLLRQYGIAANPTAARRAEMAGRIRDDEAWKSLRT